jgi:hypothetical protein
MKVLCENVEVEALDVKLLTNDCKFVRKSSGKVDLVRCYSSVRIFDFYWDLGIKITAIWHAGGIRNPKFQSPEVSLRFGQDV